MTFADKQVAAGKIVEQQIAMLDRIGNLAWAQAQSRNEDRQAQIESLRSQYDALERQRAAVFA